MSEKYNLHNINDNQIIILFKKGMVNYFELPIRLRDNPEIIIHHIKNNHFNDLSTEQKMIPEYLIEHFKRKRAKVELIPKSLLKDESFILNIIHFIENKKEIFDLFLALFREYKHQIPVSIIKEGIKKDGKILQYATEEIQGNYTICLMAVRNNGFALADTAFKNDLFMVQEAVLSSENNSFNIFLLAGKEIKNIVNKENPYYFFKLLKLKEKLDNKLIHNNNFIHLSKKLKI